MNDHHPTNNNEEYVVEEVLHAEQSTTVSRVRHNNNTMIIKFNTKLLTQPRKLIKYYQEFMIGSSIESPFVVRYVDFKKINYGYAILMEDIGGTALTNLYKHTKQGLPLDVFLEIACKITKGIGAIHGAGVIHKNINPSNIIYCEGSGELNIIDFGISSQLSKSEISPTSIPFGNKDVAGTHDNGVEMEGTLEYISPEQTGRMNRVVDYRSDFYSLGVTFYELLTGIPPFTQSGPQAYIDLVYKHLAVHPRSILEIRPEVGSALWGVVAKLMAKNAEDRYQDHNGLLYDLQEIQRAQKEGRHENMLGFVAGSTDRAMHLQVSQKLYGREEEVRKLTRNFEQVCSEGTLPSMLMLVHGYSGVGKTLIVNEVHKPLAKSHGNYVSGKFDQFLSASPYSAVIQALKQLIQQILTESESSLKSWQHRMEEGLKGSGKLMVELIPDLELVIALSNVSYEGPQPEVPMLEAVENVHRFKAVFIGFISSLACKERPLVMFLDDLQWADSNTLDLLLALLTDKAALNTRYLLIVGAYRDNEVSKNHPLSLTLQEMRSKGATVEDVSVSSLREEQVVQLLDDTFNSSRNSTYKMDLEPLGRLVNKTTQGNPFFVNQLLTTLYKNGHIRFFSELDGQIIEGWKCDVEAIQKENYASNVVDLMVSMLRKLPQAVQQMVGVAATIGNQVELWLLAVACNISEYEARSALNSAISEGYLIPSSDEYMRNIIFSDENSTSLKQLVFPESSASSSLHMIYRFAHDRVQQAAALLITQEDRKIIHGRIAEVSHRHFIPISFYTHFRSLLFYLFHDNIKTLLSRFGKDAKELANHLLIIATHMNQSFDEATIEYDTDLKEGETKHIFPFHAVHVAEVNYKAALRAKNANAFQQALTYASLGVILLAKDKAKAWEKYHTLSFDIYKLFFELQVMTGNYSDADTTYAQLIPRATSLQAKTDVYITMFHRFELEHRLAESIEPVARALALYGFILPMDAKEQERVFLDDVDLIDEKLEGLIKFSDLLDLPECADTTQQNIIKLLITVWPAAYMLGMRYLSGYLSSQAALRSMEHGVCAETGMALVSYVWISGPITGEYIKLNEFAKIGLNMLDLRYPHQKALRGSSTLLYAVGVSVWVQPLIKAFPYIQMAFEFSSQAGNLDFMTFSAIHLVETPFMCGTPLSMAALEYEKNDTFWKEGNFGLYPVMRAIGYPVYNLQGVQQDLLQGQQYEDAKDIVANSYFHAKLFPSFFLRNDMKKWLQYADISAAVTPIYFMGLYKVAEMKTMVSLIYLDWLGRSPFARETFAPKSYRQPRELGGSNRDADIESEAGHTREQQQETLHKRIEMIKSSIESLSKASLNCKENFEHKVQLLKAEASRVALALDSDAIFSSGTSSHHPSSRSSADSITQSFEETMELYESAIKGAKQHGFMQYEALGLELYGRFWLTTRTARPRIALLYLTEAILAYERWGATEKARLLSDECALLTLSEPIHLHSVDLSPQKPSASVVSLDLETIVQASQTICNETDVSALIVKMVKTIVENAHAERGTFFVVAYDENHACKNSLVIAAEYEHATQKGSPLDSAGGGVILYNPQQPLSHWSNGPVSLVRFVGRTRKAVALECAHKDAQFGSDKYISEKQVKSVICMPMLLNKALKGVMYLENNLCEGMYKQNRVDLLSVLTSQMAISLENIKYLHEQMLEQSEKLRFEQSQREVQRERAEAAEKYKMQLENFIDMICHEIRNPLNGIFGNTDLILHHLGQFEAAQRRQAWMNLSIVTSPTSIQQSPASPTQNHSDSLSLRGIDSISPLSTSSPQPRLATVQDGSQLDLESTAGANIYGSFLTEVRLCATTIQSCAEHQKRMTDDVLQLSRLRSHKLVVENVYFRPWGMVQTTLQAFRVQADKKGLELRFEPQGLDERSEIFGDNIRTHQILYNLLSNAIKFTLKGSIMVVVRLEDSKSVKDDTAEGVHSVAQDHNEASQKEESEKETAPCIFTMYVADTGIGMSAKEQARIFKRFSQANSRTSKEYGGSGLGLSICKKLAKLMNGTISLESEERIGSTFTVRLLCNRVLESSLSLSTHSTEELPSVNLPPDIVSADSLTDSVDQLPQLPQLPIPPIKGEAGEAEGKVEPPKPQRILAAEDNLMNQTLLRKVLPMKGYIVDITSNGEECVARYQEYQRREGDRYYSFILMDVQMPLMDGLVATELIRRFERENNIPPIVIIGLSGNARDEYRQTALAAGMNEYITKPYHKEVLYAALAKNSS